jgi:uncharacterized protein YodC (DUF2158 family)
MKYKSGDIVIKKTGGNKMTVVQEYKDNSEYHYKCYWFVESKLYEEVFKEEEIVYLIEYKRFLKIEEREDKINQILK